MKGTLLLAGLCFTTGVTGAERMPQWSRTEVTKDQEARVAAAVTADLRDPASAQFRKMVRLVSDAGDEAYCGEVNSKNGYGGYVGFVGFYYNPGVSERVMRADGDGADPLMVDAICSKEGL